MVLPRRVEFSWNVINSGDNRHFTLQALTVSNPGTIIPRINADTVFDLENFGNLASSATFNPMLSMTSDPRAGSPTIGTVCAVGAIYAGTYSSGNHMVTPGGCDNDANPTCDGGAEKFTQKWWGTSGSQGDIVSVETITAAATNSTQLGIDATPLIAADSNIDSDSPADYCLNMNYGGYDDWVLPSKIEMAYIYCKTATASHNTSYPQEDVNCATDYGGKTSQLPTFDADWYWVTTERSHKSGWMQNFSTGEQNTNGKGGTGKIRCVRRY